MKLLRTPLLLLSLALLPQFCFAVDPYVERQDVQQFIRDVANRDHFDADTLNFYFSKAKQSPAVIKAILPPTNPRVRSWRSYRQRFVEPIRIKAGLAFWDEHADVLKKAAAQYGVPEEIIVAIIGVETIYGRDMGNFNLFSALTTLAFDYPPRAELFRRELEELLLLAREEKRSPLSYRGSFAGAMGYPQFLPSSVRRYAVDFDGDKIVDLSQSPEDAIGSVANFLSQHGWVKNAPVLVKAEISDAGAAPLVAKGILPRLTPLEMRPQGLRNAEVFLQQPVALIDLVTPDMPTEYRLGYQNFYVLTRYNRSSFYATAVYDLATALKKQRVSATAATRD